MKKISAFIFLLIILLNIHIWMTTALIVQENEYEPKLKNKFSPDFCIKPEGVSIETRGLLPIDKNKKICRDFALKNKKMLKAFINHYKKNTIPTILHNPQIDYEKLQLWDLFKIPLPDYNLFRKIGRGINSIGDYYMLSGKGSTAAAIYISVIKFGIDIGYGFGVGRTLIGCMISIAEQKIALKKLTLLFGSRKISVSQEKKILKLLKNMRKDSPDFYEFLKLEKMTWNKFDFVKHFSTEGISTMNQEGDKITHKRSASDRYLMYFFGDSATEALHGFYDEFYGLAKKGVKCKTFEESQKCFKKAMEILSEKNIFNSTFSPSEYIARIIIAIGTPNIESAYYKFLEKDNYYRALFVINRLNEFYSKNNRYPENLSDLNHTDLPVDIFSGKEFIYRREGKSFVLYSIGKDSKDDNMEKKSGKITDQIFYSPNIEYLKAY
ncbi:hypothetical protein KAJ27_06510 [bacterium]|nr:hypothetical protein [bacterium]